MFLTKYGSPWSQIPQVRGTVFWVAPSASYRVDGKAYDASDDNDGESPQRALRTVARAMVLCTAAAGDMIVLLPGTHTATASIAASKSEVTICGLNVGNFVRPKASLTTSAADEVINVTAANVEICNLRIIPVTAQKGIDYSLDADHLYIHDNSFDMSTPVADTATQGIAGVAATSAPTHLWIDHNYFECDAAQGPAVEAADSQHYLVENNVVALTTGTWAAAFSQAGVLGFGLFRNNDFGVFQNGTLTIGIRGTDITSTLSVGILRNFFGVTTTVPIDNFGSTDAWIAENYLASSGGGGGGVLWSSIT